MLFELNLDVLDCQNSYKKNRYRGDRQKQKRYHFNAYTWVDVVGNITQKLINQSDLQLTKYLFYIFHDY